MNVDQSLHNIFDEPDKYVNLAEVARWQIVFNSTLAVTLFFVWIKVSAIVTLAAHCWICRCTQGDHLPENLKSWGNLTVVGQGTSLKSGKCRKNHVGENCLFLTSHLGLCPLFSKLLQALCSLF